MANPGAVIAGVSAVVGLIGGFRSASAARRAGRATATALRENADIVIGVGEANADAYLAAGAVNAQTTLNISEANAQRIENVTDRNIMMYGLQYEEDRRRFVLNQKLVAGDIRARVGGSGLQTNTGTPRQYLVSQVKLGIQERRFGDLKAYWTVRNMWEDGEEHAQLVRFTGEQQANAIMANAEINAEMAIINAEAQAAQMENSADAALEGGYAQASAIQFQAVGAAIGHLASLYSASTAINPNTGTTQAFSTFSMQGWETSYNGMNYGTGQGLGFKVPQNSFQMSF